MNLNASIGNSASTANGWGSSNSNSWSNTAGIQATQQAIQSAINANNSAMDAWQSSASYNAEQAEIQRQWLEKMANTTYQRTVDDMRKAGINPILAAGMGLGTASVGSGATASMTAPNTFMANTFPEQNSASTASSTNQNESNSWSHSESGLATFLSSMAGLLTGLTDSFNAGRTIDINLNGLKELSANNKKDSSNDNIYEQIVDDIIHPAKTDKTGKYFLSNGVKQLDDINKYINHKSSGGGHQF